MDPISKQVLVSVVVPILFGGVGAWIGFIKMGEKVKQLDKDNDDEKKEIKEIRDKVICCETILREREPLTKRKSPVSLTERGDNFLKSSGGQKFVDDNFEELKQVVESKMPKTAYDIQEYSREAINEKKDQDIFNPLKDYLFKEGLELGDLTLVMGIYLRDQILSSKGLAPEEIDRTDPSKINSTPPQDTELGSMEPEIPSSETPQ